MNNDNFNILKDDPEQTKKTKFYKTKNNQKLEPTVICSYIQSIEKFSNNYLGRKVNLHKMKKSEGVKSAIIVSQAPVTAPTIISSPQASLASPSKTKGTYRVQRLFTQFDQYTTRSYVYRKLLPIIQNGSILDQTAWISSESESEAESEISIPYELKSHQASTHNEKLQIPIVDNGMMNKVLWRYQQIGKWREPSTMKNQNKQHLLNSIHDKYELNTIIKHIHCNDRLLCFQKMKQNDSNRIQTQAWKQLKRMNERKEMSTSTGVRMFNHK